jgi:SAM-dependent methyltransferase
MDDLREILFMYINDGLVRIIISNSIAKDEKRKVHIRVVEFKEGRQYQAAEYRDNKVFHTNMNGIELTDFILVCMREYRQMEINSTMGQVVVLISKKGKVTIKEKKGNKCVKEGDLSHNRKKRYILDPEHRVPFLFDLGVQTREGKIVQSQYHKFRQINRFLEFIEDILPKLPRERNITILDFGCGKSYLTFAMYYYLKELKGYSINITGLDLKEDVIKSCNALVEKYGYQDLTFIKGDIGTYQETAKVDMVVTLHACDIATDYALDKAIRWGAKVILSVPCCQHELNSQIENEILAPILKYGLVKERMAALITDALRAQVLESKGYQVQLLEFIDTAHTPKNILIRAVKVSDVCQTDNYNKVMDFLHVKPTLAELQQNTRRDSDA